MTIHLILDKTKRRKRDAVAQWKKPALRMLLNTTGATMTWQNVALDLSA